MLTFQFERRDRGQGAACCNTAANHKRATDVPVLALSLRQSLHALFILEFPKNQITTGWLNRLCSAEPPGTGNTIAKVKKLTPSKSTQAHAQIFGYIFW